MGKRWERFDALHLDIPERRKHAVFFIFLFGISVGFTLRYLMDALIRPAFIILLIGAACAGVLVLIAWLVRSHTNQTLHLRKTESQSDGTATAAAAVSSITPPSAA